MEIMATSPSSSGGALVQATKHTPNNGGCSPAGSSISRSQSHHHPEPPTTFVQADTATFKHVVQMLTGSSSSSPVSAPPPPPRIPPIRKKPGFKLYERRNTLKNGLMITPPAGLSPRKLQEILSPSILDFPALALSPVTPLMADTLSRRPSPSAEEEEKAIAKKKFYFHPSPRTTAAAAEPQLLPLFPVTSPRTSS